MRLQNILGSTVVMVLALTVPSQAFGPDYNEGPTDAGNRPETARRPTGSGTLSTISGSTGQEGPSDFQDMYLIQIDNPAAFRASTVAADGGAASFNTEIWLFRQNGRGLLGNDDDDDSGTPQSKIKQPATDVTGQLIPGPGLYFLAISGRNDNPLSTGFDQIFNQAVDTEISGPDGLGGANTITDWDNGGQTGDYIIALQGVSFPPPPAIPTYSEWTLIILTTLLLAAGTVVFRRQTTLRPA